MSITSVTNLCVRPLCAPVLSWWATNVTWSLNSDGKRVVTPVDPTETWAFSPTGSLGDNRYGNWLVYVLSLPDASQVQYLKISSVSAYQRGTVDGHVCWIAAMMGRQGSAFHEIVINGTALGKVSQITLLGCASYTPDDWQRVYRLYESGRLAMPYFDGDTKPR